MNNAAIVELKAWVKDLSWKQIYLICFFGGSFYKMERQRQA